MSELNVVTRLREWVRHSPVRVATLAGPFDMDSEKSTLALLLAKALDAAELQCVCYIESKRVPSCEQHQALDSIATALDEILPAQDCM